MSISRSRGISETQRYCSRYRNAVVKRPGLGPANPRDIAPNRIYLPDHESGSEHSGRSIANKRIGLSAEDFCRFEAVVRGFTVPTANLIFCGHFQCLTLALRFDRKWNIDVTSVIACAARQDCCALHVWQVQRSISERQGTKSFQCSSTRAGSETHWTDEGFASNCA